MHGILEGGQKASFHVEDPAGFLLVRAEEGDKAVIEGEPGKGKCKERHVLPAQHMEIMSFYLSLFVLNLSGYFSTAVRNSGPRLGSVKSSWSP